MYISYAILSATIFTLVLLKIESTNIDIVHQMRLLLCIGFGFVLYIPVISMLMDIFICTEQAKGITFFDIDCNSECWDSTHIAYFVFASFTLVQIIPTGMYLRVKYQEIASDLNILANPIFMFLKTTIVILMIVISKLLK